jgi:hypothetical protein
LSDLTKIYQNHGAETILMVNPHPKMEETIVAGFSTTGGNGEVQSVFS